MSIIKLIKRIKPLYLLLLWFRKQLSYLSGRRKYRCLQKQMYMTDPCSDKRQKYWVKCGAHIEGQINIGAEVYFDAGNAEHIYIGEGSWITSRCLLLCHKRDMSEYYYGSDVNKLPYIISDIHIGKNVHIGMNSIIMPGVTIGDGAIIGAGSLVTRDVPPYSLAVGSPAKVIKQFEKKNE